MTGFTRRDILQAVIAASSGAIALDDSKTSQASQRPTRPWKTIDTNLHLFQWPCRRLPYDSLETLLPKLDSLQIDQAWAGSYEGILHRDIGGVNQRLADACVKFGNGRLHPFGAINPTLPGWVEDLRQCHEVHHMHGVRIYPNYHGYDLRDPLVEQLLKMTVERKMLLQVCASLEDRRTQHPMLRVADVAIELLVGPLSKYPTARVQILNYKPVGSRFAQLASTPGLYFDTARIEGTDGFAKFLRAVPPGRVLWGSHAPFFIYESGLIKAYEANLSDDELDDLFSQNASKLLAS